MRGGGCRRPRRFGKSLLLDTIAELFLGSEELFRGLAIHESWDWLFGAGSGHGLRRRDSRP